MSTPTDDLEATPGLKDFASVIAEVMDRHDVSCPLENHAVAKEVNEKCAAFARSVAHPPTSELVDPRSDIVTAGNALVAALWAQADKDPEDDECWVLPMTHQSAIERWKKALSALRG